ncbi:MAG: methylmalonyl Co-A mutase-associated GTPase MeaB [Flavobacteriales bacterium]|jgi:LAO/AO transport system kinase|nr:methylmalonyl Co-A mutase-associated GTPase MeaB [Flavobacteriales bacterium]MBK6892797.1 methylmalonyl Co-A mutase-associated GTPase MeaB [Flavobacteriales bacterium]MBK7246941.1 methylmalonyl Co-A mutase-associated GTPase MeaB [Flavobacteriales bacterium]MBK7287314.1 methylmalonyl Co-A mutase-associated GTPase MeaB [Flavobacteriales bacterium]MBK9599128.1 methylmalonyl Co-A mutase-associated GTPase MeaB [Flavobacteriales bacterium]
MSDVFDGSPQDLLNRLRDRDRVALGRAITLVESTRPADRPAARELIAAALKVGTLAVRIGITGIPGVGKSTLIDVLGSHLVTQGHHVAVLAIDPSSTRGGGSILGDKTRMERLAADPNAFIRPSPTSGTLGGVARRTREAVILCEAAGYDRILIETVGVGQSEAAVDHLTDLNLLLMIGGAGDGLQGIKRGIMEAADLIAITKTDGDNDQRNHRAAMDLRQAIALLPPRDNGVRPPVLLCSATTEKGIPELAQALEVAAVRDLQSGHQQLRRREQDQWWMRAAIEEDLIDGFYNDPTIAQLLPDMEGRVRSGAIGPFDAAEELLKRYRGKS